MIVRPPIFGRPPPVFRLRMSPNLVTSMLFPTGKPPTGNPRYILTKQFWYRGTFIVIYTFVVYLLVFVITMLYILRSILFVYFSYYSGITVLQLTPQLVDQQIARKLVS